MTKHTPGPWEVRRHRATGEGDICLLYVSQTKFSTPHGAMAEIFLEGDEFTEVDEANARLIAAAPDLLEALKAVEDSIFILGLHTDEDDCEGCRLKTKARAAIAKAEKESL